MLDSRADQVVPDVTNEPAWPTLRANLLVLGAETGDHPLLHFYRAALGCDLSTAGDMAAVLNWRLPEPAPTQIRAPLLWLPGIPQPINDHPDWSQYLAQRSDLIANLAQHIQHQPATTASSLFGRRRVLTWTSGSSVKSPSGGLPTASTPTTADPSDQHNYRLLLGHIAGICPIQ